MHPQHKLYVLTGFCLFSLFFTDSAHAQDTIPSHIGIKGGIVFSHFRNMETNGTAVTGFQAGIYKNYRFSDLFSVEPELVYTQKGGTVTYNNKTIGLHVEYLEVPLLAELYLPVTLFSPRLFGGLSPAVKLVSYSDVELSDNGAFSPDQWPDHSKNLDLGIILGIGNDFRLSNRTLTMEIRYTHGLANAFGDQVPGSIKNSTLSILAGFTF